MAGSARACRVAPCEGGDAKPGALGEFAQAFLVLARQDLGRRHERGLTA